MRLVQRQKKKKKTKPLYQLIQAGRRVDVYCLGVGRKSWNITSSSVLAAASVALRFRWSTLGGQVVGLPSIVRGHSVPSAHRPSCCYRGAQHEEPPVLLPGRGHPRLRQRKQGAGDPHRSVSKSSFPNLSAFLLRHYYYFFFVCVCLFLTILYSSGTWVQIAFPNSDHRRLLPSFEFKPTVHFDEACV